MAMLKTYDLRGNKLSFANWISNLSPTETPFTSMISKESVDQTTYSWQTDRLSAPVITAIAEGAVFDPENRTATRVMENCTQILRKIVRVTDTTNKIGLYGRASEKAYQMEKAGKELRRDMEYAALRNGPMEVGQKNSARKFGGFVSLVAARDVPDIDTGAVVHKSFTPDAADDLAFGMEQIFNMTYNLYLAGAKANKIMFHPKHMLIFSRFIGGIGPSLRMFDNVDTKYNCYVGRLRDPLGQMFELIPNRHMSKDYIFFFNESDWTQMVLRAPESTELAKTGSSERHMIETEVGLRHRNPYASGVLELKPHGTSVSSIVAWLAHPSATLNHAVKLHVDAYKDGVKDTTAAGEVTVSFNPADGISITGGKMDMTAGTGTISGDVTATKPGFYSIHCSMPNNLSSTVELQVYSVRSAETGEEVLEAKVLGVEAMESPVKAAKARKPKV